MIINGKECGFKYNLHAIEQLDKIKGNATGGFAFASSLVWGGYLGWCFVKQVEPELTFEEICQWVDEANFNAEKKKEFEEVLKLWRESEAYKTLIKEVEADKKQAKKK